MSTKQTAVEMFNQPRLTIPQHVGDFFTAEGANIQERTSAPTLGYEGKVWQITLDGEKTKLVKRTDEGDEEPLSTMRVVILDYAKRRGRALFEGVYSPDKISAPVCASDDGVTPNVSIETPKSAKCDTCPMSVKGSKVSDSGKMLAACSQHRLLAVIPANNLEFTPLRMKIAVTSDYDKQSPDMEAQGWYAFTNYTDMLRSKGVSHTAALVTKMKFDPNAAYPKVMFSADRWLTAEEMARVVPVVRSDLVQDRLGHTHSTPAAVAVAAPVRAVVDEPPAPVAAVVRPAVLAPLVAEAPAVRAGRPKKVAAAPIAAPSKLPMVDDDDDDAPVAQTPAVPAVSDDVASLLEEWGED